MAAAGESRWPYVDSDRWPMTSSPEARRAANGEAQKGHKSPIGSPSLLYRRVLHVRHLRCRIGSLLLVERSRSGTRKEEGDNPSRVQPDWDEATGPVEYRPQSETPAPQSQPVTHASRLVTQNAPSVAFGLGRRIPAAGPAQLRLYSHSRRLRTPTANSLLRLIPMNQRTPAPTRSTGRDTTLPPARAAAPYAPRPNTRIRRFAPVSRRSSRRLPKGPENRPERPRDPPRRRPLLAATGLAVTCAARVTDCSLQQVATPAPRAFSLH